jgi:hypothetical protein
MRSLLHYIVFSRKQQQRNISLAWFKVLWHLVFAILDVPPRVTVQMSSLTVYKW